MALVSGLRVAKDFVKHYGFGPEHTVLCDDGATGQFTTELLLNELSTRVVTRIAIEFWEMAKVIAVAGGTRIYCEKSGGYMGNEELLPGHKLRAL